MITLLPPESQCQDSLESDSDLRCLLWMLEVKQN